MMNPELFGRYKQNLIKIYAILRAVDEPLPRSRILQRANLYYRFDMPLFLWLVERGFIKKLSRQEIGKKYTSSQRRITRQHKGIFKIAAKGRDVRKLYDALFNLLGLSDSIRERFPE